MLPFKRNYIAMGPGKGQKAAFGEIKIYHQFSREPINKFDILILLHRK
jgi:hypothetical protein